MRESFCYQCGKAGAWPLCKECRDKLEAKEEAVVEKAPPTKKKQVQHHPDYFVATLQNRAIGSPTEKDVWDVIYEVQEKRDFIAWKKKDDIQFTDIRAARLVAKALEKRFNLVITQSRKDVGYDRVRSKKQFKWAILLRNRD